MTRRCLPLLCLLPALFLVGCAGRRSAPCLLCFEPATDRPLAQVSPGPEVHLAQHFLPPIGDESDDKKDPKKEPGSDKDSGKKNGNGKNAKNGKEDDEPKHMRDHGFLVEEAFNQEKGEIQHIFNWINFWKRQNGNRERTFVGNYTMEIPIGSQDHQFSFTALYLTQFEQVAGRPGEQVGDVGDTFLNYRYQLLADDDFLWVAPRVSLIVPTGDKRLGTGTGELGYQFNLPISKYGERFDFHFNAGYTIVPDVSVPIEVEEPGGMLRIATSPRHDLRAYNVGTNLIYKPKTDLHFFVETLVQGFDEIDARGDRNRLTQVFLSPGVRWAIVQEPVEWVLGLAVPVGLTRDTPDIGIFAYMSIEFSVLKEKK